MRVASEQAKIKVLEGSIVTATIGIGPRSEGVLGITAALDVYLPVKARPTLNARAFVTIQIGGV